MYKLQTPFCYNHTLGSSFSRASGLLTPIVLSFHSSTNTWQMLVSRFSEWMAPWLAHAPTLGFFKGTSAEQDRRFSDKETKLLKSMKFPAEFDKKVCWLLHIVVFSWTDSSWCKGGHAQSECHDYTTLGRKKNRWTSRHWRWSCRWICHGITGRWIATGMLQHDLFYLYPGSHCPRHRIPGKCK